MLIEIDDFSALLQQHSKAKLKVRKKFMG